MESKGVIMYNRGNKCVVRSFVAIYTLRKHWQGPVTMFLESPYPNGYEELMNYFNVDIVYDNNPSTGTMVRSIELCKKTPYDRTLWLDTDTVTIGKIDEMFDYLDDCEVAIPHFAGWYSDGSIAKRIKKYGGLCSDELINKALEKNPAINCGVFSFIKNTAFLDVWLELALKGDHKMFIPDEVAFQVLYPSYNSNYSQNGVYIAPSKFNVSVKYDRGTEDKRIIHFHGQKHTLDMDLCSIWKKYFKEMTDGNIANINNYLKYADKRLVKYLNGEVINVADGEDGEETRDQYEKSDVTIVTACDEVYVDILKETFANWRKYKKIDSNPVIVYINGIDLIDNRLDFLRLPNVKMIPWKMENAENHREEMLSAFVFGPAEDVETPYWMKLDADSYATNDKPLYDDSMKEYAFCGHKWGYSRPEHIRKLDIWAKGHWKKQLRDAKPMIEDGKIEGNRFYHKTKRTISFVQLHKTKFSKFCVKLLRERKLPAPSHDTYMYYVCNRFNPEAIGIKNFKRDYGFVQGNGRAGIKAIRDRLDSVENGTAKIEEETEAEEVNNYIPLLRYDNVNLIFTEICRVPEGDNVISILERK